MSDLVERLNKLADFCESDRRTHQEAATHIARLEARVEELEGALCTLWELWNDKAWSGYKADYLKGHLSYHGMLEVKEAPIRAALTASGGSQETRAAKEPREP